MRPRLTAVTADQPRAREWAYRVAALTRAAYAAPEPMPGLPVPDGAADNAAAVYADLRGGATIWVAQGAGGVPVGALRVHRNGGDVWEVSRVAVARSARGGGVAGALLAAAEAEAVRRGVHRIRLNAVVERCLPPVYARMGYRVVGVEPNPDKPLSELVMERDPAAPVAAEALPAGWRWPRPYPSVAWFELGDVTIAVTGRYDSVLNAAARGCRQLRHLGEVRFAGVDADLSAPPAAGFHEPGVTEYRRPRATIAVHLMPRAVHSGRFAMWRCPPGREIPATSLDTHLKETTP